VLHYWVGIVLAVRGPSQHKAENFHGMIIESLEAG
jgi:hypothetical protein